MKKALIGVLVFVVFSVGALAAAKDSTIPHNVVLSDAETGFLVNCTEVRIYAVDPDTDDRLASTPTVMLSHPKGPLYLELAPGAYELAIWMFYLPSEVHYLYFSAHEIGVTLVDLMSVEFPEELVTY